jgi:tetratricopeptide (TPR) repeat protein
LIKIFIFEPENLQFMSQLNQDRKFKLLGMLAESPNDDFLNFAIAMEELALENLQLAQSYFQKCIEINPMHIPARFQLAKIAYSLQQNEKALQLLKDGITILQEKKDLKTLNEFRSLLSEIEFD